jgi:rubrerythrin
MHAIERRIHWAVGVALAAACTPAQPAPPPELAATASPSALPTTPPSASEAQAPAPSTSAPPPPPTSTVPPPLRIDAMALCTAYQRRVAADPKGPKRQTPTRDVPVSQRQLEDAGHVEAHAQGGEAVCRITWERAPISRTVMVAPRCCPPITQPCPPASPEPVPAEHAKVETAWIQADGSVRTSSLAWETWIGEPPRQPYCGRRTEGLAQPSRPTPHDLAGALAAMAELEAQAVLAFVRLGAELRERGAPPELVARARRAARDEARHARIARRLARARGAAVQRLERPRFEARTDVALARENAIEGCVNETYGATVATWLAATVTDPELAGAFAEIARDERAHAALAWDVAAWITARLSPEDAADVARARTEAEQRVRDGAGGAGPLEAPPAVARALAESLFSAADGRDG